MGRGARFRCRRPSGEKGTSGELGCSLAETGLPKTSSTTTVGSSQADAGQIQCHEKLEFLAHPDSLELKLETAVDRGTFETYCRPALKCLITDGIDICKLHGPSSTRPHASIHVRLHSPFNQSFESLAEMSDNGNEDEQFTEVHMPRASAGKVWHALEVLAVLADERFVTDFRGYSFQHMCDAAVVSAPQFCCSFWQCRSLMHAERQHECCRLHISCTMMLLLSDCHPASQA
jgi:hypothetical protein